LSTAFDGLKDNLKKEVGDALVDYVKGQIPIKRFVVAFFFILVLLLVLAHFAALGIEKVFGKLWKEFWGFFKHTRAMKSISRRFKRSPTTERTLQSARRDELPSQFSSNTFVEMNERIGGANGRV
jgi:hypothetical protein